MKKLGIFVWQLIYFIGVCNSQTRIGNPTVTISQGVIEGKDIRYDWGTVDRFTAIPYAAPPVGNLRFQPPEPHPYWGTYDATGGFGSELENKACIQPRPNSDLRNGAIGQEDCLYMNIWVPGGVDDARKNPLPVMVWIHGQANTFGSSWGPLVKNERLYDMASLATEGNVITVSFNYRLGPMGFFSTGDDNAPGNYGLLDQVFAMQWVQDNIWAFGGNANEVTIFGQDTGATNIGLHMVSPMSSNLFSRAISQSGTSLSQWAIQRDPLKIATKLATSLNCTTETNENIVACIKAKPAEELVLGLRVYGILKLSNLDLPWAPVIGGDFLPSPPEQLVMNAAGKSYLLGSNNMDGHSSAVLDFPFVRIPLVPMTELSLLRASRRLSPYITPKISQLIDYQYQEYEDGRDKKYYKSTLVDLYTDFMFTAPTYAMAQQHSFLAKQTGSGAKTFVYLFSEPKTRTFFNGEIDGTLPGAEHGQELPFVFNVPDRASLRYSRSEQNLATAMVRYWTNFAKTGDPNLGTKSDIPAYWPEYSIDNQHYLELNTSLMDNEDSAAGYSFRREYSVFWSRLVPQIYGSKSGVCDNVHINELAKPNYSVLPWKADRTFPQRPKFDLQRADYKDVLKSKQERPAARDSLCGGSGEFIRPTSSGCVQGQLGKWQGYLYSSYLGIPFAAPPVGSLRFEKPSSPDSWTGIRDATQFQKICPQGTYDPSTMSEDCLYLNIYVPIDSTLPYDTVVAGKYAVMVWLHGGSFMAGDGTTSYLGDIMSSLQDVIVVTFNYRLGALGFMSTGNRFSQGNYGLFDQNRAMQWVVDNIEAFGGDASRVTMFGQGAGAESAQLHTVSVSSRSLNMNRTILQSGTLFDFYEYPEQTAVATELMKRTSCKMASTSDSVDCLRNLPIDQLIAAQGSSSVNEIPLQFAPVVDGSFLVRDPITSNSVLSLKGWNFLIGTNSGDGTPYWDTVNAVQNGEDFENIITSSYQTKYGIASDDIQFEYTDWDNEFFGEDTNSLQRRTFAMYTNQRYASKADRVALKAATILNHVYLYSLEYPIDTTEQEEYPSWTGVMHGGDLPYIWGDVLRDSASQGANPDATVLSYKMMTYWANFAKTGDPNKNEDGVLTAEVWPRYQTRHRQFVGLTQNAVAQRSYLGGKQSAFWNLVLPTLNISCPLYVQ